MSSDELRRRLEALNGRPLANVPTEPARREASKAAPTAQRPRTRNDRSTRNRNGDADEPVVPYSGQQGPLEELLPGQLRETPSGPCYHVRRDPALLAPWFPPIGERINSITEQNHSPMFLDLETLGFQGEPVWLIGLLAQDHMGAWQCEQLIARDLTEEAAMIEALSAFAHASMALVTFNGVAFDWPMLTGRAQHHGISLPALTRHHDMLLIARTVYGRRVPNCKLQTLESVVLGRERTGDVPGHRIPAVYKEFLKTGMAGELAEAVKHNLLDLVSTAELFTLTRRRA